MSLIYALTILVFVPVVVYFGISLLYTKLNFHKVLAVYMAYLLTAAAIDTLSTTSTATPFEYGITALLFVPLVMLFLIFVDYLNA